MTELMHYGILRKSGRYPWGSGEDPYQRSMNFRGMVDKLRDQGLSDSQIAKHFDVSIKSLDKDAPDFSTTEFRATKTLANEQVRSANMLMAEKLKAKNMSNVAIGERMGINESSVRSLLDPSIKLNQEKTLATANMLKEQVKNKKYVDVGLGNEIEIGVSRDRMKVALAVLKEQGYQVMYVKERQLGTGKETSIQVLVGPGVEYKELAANKGKIQPVTSHSSDEGRSFKKVQPPQNVDPKRVMVNYAEDGGIDKDGVIELRRGVKDLDLGAAQYAQVRIAVDGTHYLKGMAVYADDLPKGVDIRFNTNKSKGTPMLGEKDHSVLKPMKDDPENPFGSQLKAGGQRGALNIVNEEGDWDAWSSRLSSQMLSKQEPSLAKKQLNLTYERKKQELDEILALTNPTVKRRLLMAYADGADSAASSLKALGPQRTATKVILPVPSMKPTEIYAPTYKNGERVALVRHPHGGTFEIPELVVNNKNPAAKKIMNQARDAVGIHPRVAEQLSGADFDGDTVLVIPNKGGAEGISHRPPLKGLKGFEPKTMYREVPGMKIMGKKLTQKEMGSISNLITDMTIKGANEDELARAVRHSMVVIDANKHRLNYRQSYADNKIGELKKTYQGGVNKGANTLISLAGASVRIPEIKPRLASEGGSIDPKTGKKVYTKTGATYPETKKDPVTGKPVPTGKILKRTTKVKGMDLVDDANELSSGTLIEKVYATYANQVKGLANQARRVYVNTPDLEYSKSARIAYQPQVKALNAKLALAKANKPLERQAQLLANAAVKAKVQANPDMDSDTLKKVKGRELEKARLSTGAKKSTLPITPLEWEAIQAGAISKTKLSQILDTADLDTIKEYATPRTVKGTTPATKGRIKAMLGAGYTQAEIASALGISTSTVNATINGKD